MNFSLLFTALITLSSYAYSSENVSLDNQDLKTKELKGFFKPRAFIPDMPSGPYDVSLPFKNSKVYIPGKFFEQTLADIPDNNNYPTVLYMHGCGGVGEHAMSWANFLKNNGYIVILPNAYAMPNLPKVCGYSESTRNFWKEQKWHLRTIRKAELFNTAKQLKDYPWVKSVPVLFMGHSAGGWAGEQFFLEGFDGMIISGTQCVKESNIPNTVPLLAINHDIDPYFIHKGNPKCSKQWHFKDNVYNKEVLLEGTDHFTSHSDIARMAVLEFLIKFSN